MPDIPLRKWATPLTVGAFILMVLFLGTDHRSPT